MTTLPTILTTPPADRPVGARMTWRGREWVWHGGAWLHVDSDGRATGAVVIRFGTPDDPLWRWDCSARQPVAHGLSDREPAALDAVSDALDAAERRAASESYGHRSGHAVQDTGDCAPWCDACRLEEQDRRQALTASVAGDGLADPDDRRVWPVSRPWWTCTHAGIGLPGCPTCDGRLPPDARDALRQARTEIEALRAERDRLTAEVAGLRADVEALALWPGGPGGPVDPPGTGAERDRLAAELAEARAELAADDRPRPRVVWRVAWRLKGADGYRLTWGAYTCGARIGLVWLEHDPTSSPIWSWEAAGRRGDGESEAACLASARDALIAVGFDVDPLPEVADADR